MSALLALAERCEQATGPDRELCLAIAQACGFINADAFPHSDGSHWWADGIAWGEIPHYATSLDAAMTLVPEGMVFGVEGYLDHAEAWVRWPYYDANENRAATPALALCAAALKARGQ